MKMTQMLTGTIAMLPIGGTLRAAHFERSQRCGRVWVYRGTIVAALELHLFLMLLMLFLKLMRPRICGLGSRVLRDARHLLVGVVMEIVEEREVLVHVRAPPGWPVAQVLRAELRELLMWPWDRASRWRLTACASTHG